MTRITQIPLLKLRGDSCFHTHDYANALVQYRAVCRLCQDEMRLRSGAAASPLLEQLLENTLVAMVHTKRARGLAGALKELRAPAKAQQWVDTSSMIGVHQTWSGHELVYEELRTARLRELERSFDEVAS